MELNVKSFSLTTALIWAIALFTYTWWVILFDGSTGDPTIIATLYRGYSISPAGSFIGLIWAFFDGMLWGALFAWLYNILNANKKNETKNEA